MLNHMSHKCIHKQKRSLSYMDVHFCLTNWGDILLSYLFCRHTLISAICSKLGPQIRQDHYLIWMYISAWLAGASSSIVLFNLRTHFITKGCPFLFLHLVCSSPNISASTWPKLKIKDSFEILRTSRFQNCPSFLNLVKIWGSYCQKTNCIVFLWTPCSFI